MHVYPLVMHLKLIFCFSVSVERNNKLFALAFCNTSFFPNENPGAFYSSLSQLIYFFKILLTERLKVPHTKQKLQETDNKLTDLHTHKQQLQETENKLTDLHTLKQQLQETDNKLTHLHTLKQQLQETENKLTDLHTQQQLSTTALEDELTDLHKLNNSCRRQAID